VHSSILPRNSTSQGFTCRINSCGANFSPSVIGELTSGRTFVCSTRLRGQKCTLHISLISQCQCPQFRQAPQLSHTTSTINFVLPPSIALQCRIQKFSSNHPCNQSQYNIYFHAPHHLRLQLQHWFSNDQRRYKIYFPAPSTSSPTTQLSLTGPTPAGHLQAVRHLAESTITAPFPKCL